MLTIYSGTVVTDAEGTATVTLPEYFEALNTDFQYQLTVIGEFAQAIIQSEIDDNTFTIATSVAQVKVCWQVTGRRHDAYAQKYRPLVEEEKPPNERGLYLHPEAFGVPVATDEHGTRVHPGIARSGGRMTTEGHMTTEIPPSWAVGSDPSRFEDVRDQPDPMSYLGSLGAQIVARRSSAAEQIVARRSTAPEEPS
jgi:hypothetical protein